MLSGPGAAGEEVAAGVAQLADEVVSVTEEEAARAAVETVSHSGLQVDGERAGWAGCEGCALCCLAPVRAWGGAWRRSISAALNAPGLPLAPPAAATGVAVAGFYKLASRMGGKHVVIIVCGGNVSAEGMQQLYAVAGTGAAAAAAGAP